MREIKFRAWDEEEQKMYYFGLHETDQGYLIKDEECVDDMPTMQSTGLKDRDGKESYRSDIYHLGKFTDEYIMEWHNESAMFYLRGIHGGCNKPASDVKTGTRIGNVHENPELKGGTK